MRSCTYARNALCLDREVVTLFSPYYQVKAFLSSDACIWCAVIHLHSHALRSSLRSIIIIVHTCVSVIASGDSALFHNSHTGSSEAVQVCRNKSGVWTEYVWKRYGPPLQGLHLFSASGAGRTYQSRINNPSTCMIQLHVPYKWYRH